MEASNSNDQRFEGEGITFKCKIVGTIDVTSPDLEGGSMCAETFKQVKANAKRRGQHKQRIIMHISLKGIEIVDVDSQKVQQECPLNKISYITSDPDDKKIFGYVCSQPFSTGYKLYAMKSENPAQTRQTVIDTLNELFQVAYNRRRQEAGSNGDVISHDLEVGSTVEVPMIEGSPRYGVIRWIGNIPHGNKLIAGLEMDEEKDSYSDGRFRGERYFTCPPGRSCFILLMHCRPDSRFSTTAPTRDEPFYHKEEKIRTQQELREKKQQVEYLYGQLSAMERQVTNCQAQLHEKELEAVSLNRQLTEKERQERNSLRQYHEMEQQLTNLHAQFREKDEQLQNSEGQIREMEEQLTNARGEIREKDNETAALQERLGVTLQQVGTLEEQLRTQDQAMNELQRTLSTAQQALRGHQGQQSPDWVMSRDQIELRTDKLLGEGGWGIVVEGKYCGCVVAVKQIHRLILSRHNRRLFEREMNIASKCRHPCLLQFIRATNDEGSPLFVTELMETSLRALLEQRSLSTTEVSVISLDVARALNYLHQKQPSPIIHRDVSSANVLLWRQGDQWRGKVSDYGTANVIQHTMTVAPGAVIYSAPEAVTSNQTVKVDVYSFGVLLCEMSIQELPDPERRDEQVAMVTNSVLRALIRGCLQSEPEERPSMEEIIDELEQSE